MEVPTFSAQNSSPPDEGDSKAGENYAALVQLFQRKPRRLKKDGTPYKPRKGWGPFRSVPNERAAAFNLQLDVQNLQQEIHNMTVLRDILRTKILLQRDSPDGSFAQVVSQFFHVFHKGVQLRGSGFPQLVAERYRGQQEFLRSVMDPDVDAGNGLFGPDVMMQQMVIYSTFLRFMCYRMHSFDIVKAEDSVVITTHSTLRFQILRQTIEKVFPHIMGNEWLVAQLLGNVVEPNVRASFYFNDAGKCCKYKVGLDFVGALAGIVKDPSVVDKLLNRALISDNCMFGVIENGNEDKPEASYVSVPTRVEHNSIRTTCFQLVDAYYRECVFPHGMAYPKLCNFLVSEILVVPSQIVFSIEKDARRIYCIEERMDFATAIADIIKNEQELKSVLSQAKLSMGNQGDQLDCWSLQAKTTGTGPTRTMGMHDILSWLTHDGRKVLRHGARALPSSQT